MSKFKIIIPLLLIAVFMVSTYSVVADGGSGQVQVQVQSNQVQIESENHFNGTSNSISVEIAADEGLSVNFGFSGETINHTESELHIKLRARSVVEFIDNNTAVPGYDLNDTVLNTIGLRNAVWSFSVTNTTVSNTTLYHIDAKAYLDQTNTSSIGFNFVLSTGYAAISNSTTLAPNAIKWTVVINNYSFNNSQSKLALQMQMQSGQNNDGFESDHISNTTEAEKDGLTTQKESAVNFGNQTGSKGFFSWADNYTVDGVNDSVVTSPSVSVDHEDSSYNQMYFTFNQGNLISWDPSVGVNRASLPSANLGLLSVTSTSTSTSTSSSSVTSSYSSSSSAGSPSKSNSAPGFELFAVILSIGVLGLVNRRWFKN